MLRKLANRIHRGERGITGLETAIILIAFVVVAAVCTLRRVIRNTEEPGSSLFRTGRSTEHYDD